MVATAVASYFLLTGDYGPEPNVLDPVSSPIFSFLRIWLFSFHENLDNETRFWLVFDKIWNQKIDLGWFFLVFIFLYDTSSSWSFGNTNVELIAWSIDCLCYDSGLVIGGLCYICSC